MKTLFLIPIFASLLSACGSSEESDYVEDPYTINGSWKVDCYNDSFNIYISRTIIFSAYNLTATNRYYSDIDCSIPISDTSMIGGTFKIENEITTGSGVKASVIDLSLRILNGVDYGSEGAEDFFNLFKIEDNVMYLSYGFSSQTPTDLNFDAKYYKQ